jgi:hypothetical protein
MTFLCRTDVIAAPESGMVDGRRDSMASDEFQLRGQV